MVEGIRYLTLIGMKKQIISYLFAIVSTTCFLISCKKKESIQPSRTVKGKNTTYLIQDSILIQTRDGAKIHAIVVRDAKIKEPSPAILFHTIYSKKSDLQKAKMAADRGYVGVISYTRGKGLSPDSILPFKKKQRTPMMSLNG